MGAWLGGWVAILWQSRALENSGSPARVSTTPNSHSYAISPIPFPTPPGSTSPSVPALCPSATPTCLSPRLPRAEPSPASGTLGQLVPKPGTLSPRSFPEMEPPPLAPHPRGPLSQTPQLSLSSLSLLLFHAYMMNMNACSPTGACVSPTGMQTRDPALVSLHPQHLSRCSTCAGR